MHFDFVYILIISLACRMTSVVINITVHLYINTQRAHTSDFYVSATVLSLFQLWAFR